MASYLLGYFLIQRALFYKVSFSWNFQEQNNSFGIPYESGSSTEQVRSDCVTQNRMSTAA